MRKSFTWFLSLMVLLTAFATHGYSQTGGEAQETVELYAEEASYCYNEADDYTVTISVRDFIKLSQFELALEFNDEIFSFEGASGIHTSLSTTTIAQAGGLINIDWTGTAGVTIGDNVKTDIMVLHFSLLGYPGNVATSFASDMAWGTTNFWYDIPEGTDLVNTDISTDGSLLVEVEHSGIEVEFTTETCAGGDVTVTVTAPEAAFYLFNEDPSPANWVGAWSTSPEYDVEAGDVVTIRVKDANGCMSLKQTVIVPETLAPVTFDVTTQDPACFGEKGSVVIHAFGGTAPYTYFVATTEGEVLDTYTNFQFNYEPGTYLVAVQDANECADLEDVAFWQEITINPNEDVLSVTPSATDVSCNGGSDGTISVTVVNVTQVSLNEVNWVNVTEGSYLFEDLIAGTYTVYGKNESGCTVEATGVVVAEPAAITFDMEITDTSCGGEVDGAIAVTNILGGTAPYTLTIQEGENVTTQAAVDAAGFTFEGLKPTYYSLTITDANGCVVEYINPNNTQNVISVQSPEDIQFVVEITDPLCLDGSAWAEVVNITGGTGTYEILFNGAVAEGASFEWVAPYADLTVTVQNVDGEACPVEIVYTAEDLVNPALLEAEVLDYFAPTCIEGNDGSIRLQITGGTAPYYYSINGSSARETNDLVTNIRVGVGEHTILVWDVNECEIESEIVQVVEMDTNELVATSDLHIDCFGDRTGTINVTYNSWADGLEGGQPVRGLQWFIENEDGQVSSFMPSNGGGTTTLFYAGTYIVWAVDQYTCESNRDTVVITQNPELLIDVVYTTAAACFETFEGTVTIHATGGNVPEGTMLQYAVVNNEAALGNIEEALWLDFDTYDDVLYDPALSTVSFKVDGGTYWIAVRDEDCDEVWYGPVDVPGYEELLVDEDDIVAMDPLCFEGATGSITVPMSAVTGGAGSYLFTLLLWEEGGWVEVDEDYTDLATGEFTGLPAGTYAVLVEDSEDCPSYTTEEIVLTDPELLEFETTIYHFSCLDANDGRITLTVNGGVGDYWYAINNQNAWVAFGEGLATKTYIATEPGTFTIWVKDENECITEPVEVTILEPEALDAEIEVTDATCYGIANGSINVEGLGGWAGQTLFEFKVNENGTWTSATNIGSLPAGSHTLYIRDVNGYTEPYQALDCEYTVPFTVGSPAPITYDVVIENVSCKDGADGTLTVNVLSGGTPYIVGDVNYGYQVRITGDLTDETDWTGGDYSITFDELAHSHYTVYITDANGCVLAPTVGDSEGPYVTIESWEIQEPATYLTLEAEWVQDVTCFDGEDGQFVLHAEGGTAPYKYWAGLSVEPDGHILVPQAPEEGSDEWQDSNEFNVGAGTWVVWVMDANGCIVGGEYENEIPVNKWRVKVEQPDAVEWAFHTVGTPPVIHYVQPSCFGAWDGSIHLVNVSGGSGTYNAHVTGTSADGQPVDTTYIDIEPTGSLWWLNGVPASDINGLQVTVTDSEGCTSHMGTIHVDQPEELVVELIKSEGSFTCADAVEGWIETIVTGGNPNALAPYYEYQLLKNGVVHTEWQAIASAFLVQIGNEFTVQVRDAKGCEAEATIDIQQIAEVEYTVDDLSCADDAQANVRINVTGEPGRTFRVWYKQFEDDEYTTGEEEYTAFNGWFEESIVISGVFDYDDENLGDRHYAIYVEDSEGCVSVVDTFTFDNVQSAVVAAIESVESTECSETFTVTVSGGVGPYTVMVNDSVMTETTFTLPRGTYTLNAMDSHECSGGEVVVEVVGEYVTRDTTITTNINYDTQFVDAEAGVDTMLVEGTYEFVYMAGDCERTLNVEVVGVPMPLTIAEIQGEGAVTEVPAEDVVVVTGTVTGVSAGEGFFMQDANAAWSGIWVEYAETTELAVGDGVEVVGSVSEVATVTTLTATEVTEVEAPIAVEAVVAESPSAVENEMWESVLVTVEGGRARPADEGNGEWSVYFEPTDDVIVNDWLFEFAPVDSTFYNVTGVVNTRLEAFKLEPRMESDIVDLGATPAPIVDGIQFNVYPNPFNDRIFIDNNVKVARVVMNNIAGQRVLDIEYPNREIRTANLVSGVYVISLYTEDGVRAKSVRIVKR